jgi:hypothetical protein
MTTKLERTSELEEAKRQLRELLHPGDTIYTMQRHVSRSGMYRAIDLFVMENNQPRRISWTASKLLEGYDRKHEACKASGCGMDMGFHLVYSLSYALFPGGFDCIGEHCPSNDHINREQNTHHTDGGYALRHQWL